MQVRNETSAEREVQRAEASRGELIECLARAIRDDGMVEPLDDLRLRRASEPTELGHATSYPSLCVIAQGRKETRLGDKLYRYDSAHYLIASTALPIASRVAEATAKQPYLGIVLRLSPAVVGSIMVEVGHPASRRASLTAMAVSPLDADLLEDVVRLIRLLDTPADARVLAPLIKREIIYRLLVGEQGDRVRQVAALGGDTNRIAQAITRLRKDFDRPLRIDAMARELGMSVSGFHHHFKEVTAMSPLQFQKQLRLQEARRLMIGEDLDATSAGFRVGYDDTSQFTREYKRLFGEPPMRDVARLRGAPRDYAGL